MKFIISTRFKSCLASCLYSPATFLFEISLYLDSLSLLITVPWSICRHVKERDTTLNPKLSLSPSSSLQIQFPISASGWVCREGSKTVGFLVHILGLGEWSDRRIRFSWFWISFPKFPKLKCLCLHPRKSTELWELWTLLMMVVVRMKECCVWLAGSFSLDVSDADSVVCLMASSVSDGCICCCNKHLLCIPVGHYKIKNFGGSSASDLPFLSVYLVAF
jgi:hypothetical protein